MSNSETAPLSIGLLIEQWESKIRYGRLGYLKSVLEALDFVISEEENIRRWTRSNSHVFASSDGRRFPITEGLCALVVTIAVRSNYATTNYNITSHYLTSAFNLEKYGQDNWYPITLPDRDGAELFGETTPEQKWSFGDYAEARWKYAREFREWLVNFTEEYVTKVEAKEQTNAKSS